MKQNLAILLCIIVFWGCSSPWDAQPAKITPHNSAVDKFVVASDNSFGFRLFSQVNMNERNNNVFISPFSVSMAFGMVLNGANGTTLDSLEQSLGDAGLSLEEINNSYKNISSTLANLDASVVFQNANSIWYKTGFSVLQEFINDNKTYFDADVTSLNFSQPSAVSTINNWVNVKTDGKIPTILEKIPSDAVMYLINAIYFKGTWTNLFDPKKTSSAPFTCSDGSIASCSLMYQRVTFAYYADSNMQAIDLPYGNKSFSMTVILPNSGTSIDQFAEGLTQDQWNTITGNMDSSKVDLYIPKFTIEFGKSLNNELKALGMNIAFSKKHANFTRVNPMGGLYIDSVEHKTFLKVDEEGTEAAAVTSIGHGINGGPFFPLMRIDHPFILAIREHQSGTILFIGKIANPSAQ
ncbi:MAG: serpin family protein [Bacteroidota bacterium]